MVANATGWDAAKAAAIVQGLRHLEGAALPMMHALQGEFGHVPEAAVPLIAEALNLSRAEVFGTLTFYHDFRRVPAGRHVVKLCRAEACQAAGAEARHAELKAAWGVDWHGTTADGEITVEPVYCLGLCANGPAALVDNEPLAHMNHSAITDLIAEMAA